VTGRSYCTRCDDYGHDILDHKNFLSKSEVRRLKVVKGKDWWVDEDSIPNGIGPICFFCGRLIDLDPNDHHENCPVRKYKESEIK
jgi:hypothetical protein